MTLHLDLRWTEPPNGEAAGHALGWGDAVLYLDEQPIWFRGKPDAPEPISWSWIELLEFLARNWAYLAAEESYPLGLTPANPKALREALTAYWKRSYRSESGQDADDEEVFRFERRHDLAHGLSGLWLASILIVREGKMAWVCTDEVNHQVSFEALLSDLERIGSKISSHVSLARGSDRARAAQEAWTNRESVPKSRLVKLLTGLEKAELDRNPDWRTFEFWEIHDGLNAASELSAAARFFPGSAASDRDRRAIVEAVRAIPPSATTALDALSDQVAQRVPLTGAPYEQGYALAHEFASAIQKDAGSIDPEGTLKALGVAIVELTLSEVIDAIGCWGPKHGPAVVINARGRRAHSIGGRRATFAHELCHLLVDRKRSLPLAEVLGGRSPAIPEKRAGAFAAELLLPRWVARNTYKEQGSLDPTIDRLCEKFQVSKALAANQLYYAKGAGTTYPEQEQLKRMIQREDAVDPWDSWLFSD